MSRSSIAIPTTPLLSTLKRSRSHVPLNMRELSLLRPALKLVLLEESQRAARKLSARRRTPQQISELITSLRDVTEAPWKELLEPLIAFEPCWPPIRRRLMRGWIMPEPRALSPYGGALRGAFRLLGAGDCAACVELARDSTEASEHADPRLALRKCACGLLPDRRGRRRASRGAPECGLPLAERVQEFLRRHPDEFYLGGIEVLTLLIVIAIMTPVYNAFNSFSDAHSSPFSCCCCRASQSAVEVMNYLTTALLRPRILPKLDFCEGIPDDCVTMVVVPTLLLNEKQVRAPGGRPGSPLSRQRQSPTCITRC